ncbi:MAG: CPBP family intramembrane metalloprotease [Gemmatimonadales bacterium]|nr:CPBP family intramembrane metalloprotease [Gemmatimonadales bacterium]
MAVLAYFAVYMTYQFRYAESDIAHWITLVLLPFVLLHALRRLSGPTSFPADTLRAVGLRRRNLRSGLIWAIPLGLVLSALPMLFSERRQEVWRIIESGKVLYLFPLATVLLLLTAGFTEEFFFRGILQTRLARWIKSNVWAVVVTAVLFGLYHVPYAYLKPQWPSYGNLEAAFRIALFEGGVGGLILGAVYVKARGNLLACIVMHALIDVFPAMTMVKFGQS